MLCDLDADQHVSLCMIDIYIYIYCLFLQGDGLEFKRHFTKIKKQMKAVVSKVPPTWPLVPSQVS